MPSNKAVVSRRHRIRTIAARQAGRVWLCLVLALAPLADGLAAELACPAVPRRHLDLPVTRAALSGGQPIRIVAFGSSSTEGAGASAPDKTYPARLAALLRADWPGADLTVANRGIGGQALEAMLARLDTDVLAARPTLVIWQVGANDALRRQDPGRFATLLDDAVQRILAIGSDVVLMDNQLAPKMPVVDGQDTFGAILAREAGVRSVSLFSRTALMREWQAASSPDDRMIGPDGLHHTDRGYACLATALGDAIAGAVVKPVVAVHTGRK